MGEETVVAGSSISRLGISAQQERQNQYKDPRRIWRRSRSEQQGQLDIFYLGYRIEILSE